MAQLSTPPIKRFSLGRNLPAFRHHNFRLWFFGQLFSLFGTWMQSTAQQYLVYELTGSKSMLGTIAFASGIGSVLLMLYGGIVADRMSRRTLMLITQTAMMLLAFVLALLTLTGLVQFWHILVLAFLLGVANAFDTPARLAFVLEMVDREDLTNAIALNGTMFNLSAVIGPAVAGMVYGLLGPTWCFVFNGVSFLAIIIALLLMRNLRPTPRSERRAGMAQLREAFHYVIHEPIVRTIFSLVGIGAMFGISFATLLPAWATETLGGNEQLFGYLTASRGLGAVLSAVMLASLGRFRFKGRLLTIGSFVFPPLLFLFAFARWWPLSLLLLAGVGIGTVLVFNLSNSFVQELTPDALRGRVMGLYGLVFFALMSLGSLLAGWGAQALDSTVMVIIGAAVCMGTAVFLYFFVPRLRNLE
jgi:MFS family permease